MKVGVKQISELSGFSIATVSNVLNNKKSANKKTAETILHIAQELGYRTAPKIKTIKLVQCKKHGSVLGDSPFFSALIEGVQLGCQANDYKLEMLIINHSDSDYAQEVQSLLLDNSAAILLLATELDEEDMKCFENSKVPLVVLDNWYGNMLFNATVINNVDSACNATTYLIDRGHRNIGYLTSTVSINNFREREYGLTRALTKAGLQLEDKYVVHLRPTTDGAFQDMTEYLATTPELPTAFFSDNDTIALGAMKALQEKGYKIPEDISLIGFDDTPFHGLISPALTTMRVFKEEMGVAAVEMLNRIINNPTAIPYKQEISTCFIPRQSVQKL